MIVINDSQPHFAFSLCVCVFLSPSLSSSLCLSLPSLALLRYHFAVAAVGGDESRSLFTYATTCVRTK